MLLRAGLNDDMEKSGRVYRSRALALACLVLWPLRSSAFLLNLTLHPHRIAAAGTRSSSRAGAAAAAVVTGRSRGAVGWKSRCSTARSAAAAEGSSPKSEKVCA